MSQDSNNYTAMEDGSLLYDKPIRVASPHWIVDPVNERKYIPVVPACTARKIELRVLHCGRRRANWKCTHFNKPITVKDCNECGFCQH